MPVGEVGAWWPDWMWGIPIIVCTVVVHVIGLGLIRERFLAAGERAPGDARLSLLHFAVTMGITVLLATMLHTLEAGLWAAAFVGLGALPDAREAMLYSLNAITAFGHAPLFLAPQWQMLGALEALNGVILFGLTTAFLYSMIQQGRHGSGR